MIAIISDLHYGSIDDSFRSDISNFKSIVTDPVNNVSGVVVPGDLTSNGFDGIIRMQWLWELLGEPNTICIGGGRVNELGAFLTEFVAPLEPRIPVYAGYGNHDTYNGASRYPVLDWIKRKYGGLPYWRDIGSPAAPVRLFMCGLYPDAPCRKYLARELANIGAQPCIIAFHYSMNSSWWSEADKSAFYDVIKAKNVKALVVGHTHESSISAWNGISVYNGSGDEFILLNLYTNEVRLEARAV